MRCPRQQTVQIIKRKRVSCITDAMLQRQSFSCNDEASFLKGQQSKLDARAANEEKLDHCVMLELHAEDKAEHHRLGTIKRSCSSRTHLAVESGLLRCLRPE